MFWGLSPAINLLEHYKTETKRTLPNDINIVLVGGVDCRHVLLTCARRYRYKNVNLHFYIIEACMENVGKQLLLMNIALQPPHVLGLEQKTKFFMEIYGNTIIRPSVAKYLSATAIELVKMITDYNYLSQMMPNVHLEIKYKERDYLENLLKFWCSQDEFNICDYWDKQLRKMLGVRYDTKSGVFDWDLHMKLRTIGANQICNQEYQNFREKGISFTWLESEVSKPNRSLVCGVVPNGDSFVHYGYLGDIQTGPFIAFGLSCEDKNFLKSSHGQNSYRATDVTERNLRQIFYELCFQKEYEHQVTSDYQLGGSTIRQSKLVVDVKGEEITPKPTKKCINLGNVNVTFQSVTLIDAMKRKEKYKNLFDIIYFSSSYIKYLNLEFLENVSNEVCLLLIENEKYIVQNRKEHLEEFERILLDKLDKVSFLEKLPFDVHKDDFGKYLILKNV